MKPCLICQKPAKGELCRKCYLARSENKPTMSALAIPPYTRRGSELVSDSTGAIVLACAEGDFCPLRFNEREVDKDGHFQCPNCGRLVQRMIEATPEQCGL